MLFTVREEGLETGNGVIIPWVVLRMLTGKDFNNWTTSRLNERVICRRRGGHTRFYDMHIIAGCTYKNGGRLFQCRHIAEDGMAMMVQNDDSLNIIPSILSGDWEIV